MTRLHLPAVLAVLLSAGPAAGQPNAYTVTHLGTLPGQTSSVPWGINATGDVTGWSIGPGNTSRAFLFTDAAGMTDIGLPANGSSAYGRDINDQGHVTGRATVSAGARAFRWTPGGGFLLLGTLGGSTSEGWAINGAGDVAGASAGTSFFGLEEPFRYTDATGMVALTPSSSGRALDINTTGRIAGYSGSSAFRFTPGSGVQFLGSLPNLPLTFGEAINDAGDVAGIAKSLSGNTAHLFRYSDASGMQDLGSVGHESEVWGMNNNGTIVGKNANGITFGFRFTPANGFENLNNLIPSASGWTIISAHGINDAGQIIASASHPSFPNAGAVRLDPVVQASTTAVGTGCGGGTQPPSLTATPPVLGQTLTFTLGGGTPDATGILVVSPGPSVSTPLGSGCTVFVDLGTAFTLTSLSTGTGGSGSFALPLAPAPWMAGMTFTAQAALFGTAGPLGVDLTNGLELTLGQ